MFFVRRGATLEDLQRRLDLAGLAIILNDGPFCGHPDIRRRGLALGLMVAQGMNDWRDTWTR
jgi:hypothetical protein